MSPMTLNQWKLPHSVDRWAGMCGLGMGMVVGPLVVGQFRIGLLRARVQGTTEDALSGLRTTRCSVAFTGPG